MPMSGPLERHHEATAAAEAQYGVISHQQLVTLLHMSEGEIRSQLNAARWQRVFRGVYAVTTGDLPIESWWWAAHLRCGPQSMLAGRSALKAWGVLDTGRWAEADLPVEVAVPRSASYQVPGLEVSRPRALPPSRSPRGLPPAVTAETALLDVSSGLAPIEVMDLVSSAMQRRLVSPARLERAMSRGRIRHRKLLADLLAETRDGVTTPIERSGVRNILKAHGLPTGRGQVRERVKGRTAIRDRVIDGLIIEFDGRLGHADPRSRLRDLARDNAAVMSGRPTLRFGWTDVHEQPCAAADQVAEVLSFLTGDRIEMFVCSSRCQSGRAIKQRQVHGDV